MMRIVLILLLLCTPALAHDPSHVMVGPPSATRQLILERILAARCQAARYLAHNFNDLPNNIAAVVSGSALEQIPNRRADCRLGVLGAIKNIRHGHAPFASRARSSGSIWVSSHCNN